VYVKGGGPKHSQVSVLLSGQTPNKWPKDFQTVPATREFKSWRKNEGVLVTSWRPFKGLEADAIVIVETADKQKVLPISISPGPKPNMFSP